MTTSEIRQTLEMVSGTKVLVVGDVMLDRYWWGAVSRISPEAPVPVVALQRETAVLGGAANVAANIVGLGGRAVLCGVLGEDEAGAAMMELLRASDIDSRGILKSDRRPTTVKTRILAQHQQVARIDSESIHPLDEKEQAGFEDTLLPLVAECDIVLVSDYAKGLLTPMVLSDLIAEATRLGRKVVVDPKGADFSKYDGAFMLTPNQKEAIEALPGAGPDADSMIAAAVQMFRERAIESILITRGEHGMLRICRDGSSFSLPATARDVYDVTGAGDTVIATLACGLGGGLTVEASIELANLAAGIVIEHIGTTAISRELLLPSA